MRRRKAHWYSSFALALCWLHALQGVANGGEQLQQLSRQVAAAQQVFWARFYQERTGTFADYLSSYAPGKELAHLPTAEEVSRQYPNPCGYGTGMEDGLILGGAMLSLLVDQYAVTQDRSLHDQAKSVFEGIQKCATVHGVPGFLARNVCAEDQRSVYINSSRDQYTHAVHGLWRYYRSPLADESTKQSIANQLAAVADRMIEFVRPENGYDFCRADGERCPLGICRMWNVQPHEAARLPMIYAAAWDATGDETYRALWRKYLPDAVVQSANPDRNMPAYAMLQMQCSLELLYELEPDENQKQKLLQIMQSVAELADRRAIRISGQLASKSDEEMSMLGPDWRAAKVWINQGGYLNPQWGPYREIWSLTREVGEAALVPLMVKGSDLTDAQRDRLQTLIAETNYLHRSSCGIVYHLAAYWKALFRAQVSE